MKGKLHGKGKVSVGKKRNRDTLATAFSEAQKIVQREDPEWVNKRCKMILESESSAMTPSRAVDALFQQQLCSMKGVAGAEVHREATIEVKGHGEENSVVVAAASGCVEPTGAEQAHSVALESALF